MLNGAIRFPKLFYAIVKYCWHWSSGFVHVRSIAAVIKAKEGATKTFWNSSSFVIFHSRMQNRIALKYLDLFITWQRVFRLSEMCWLDQACKRKCALKALCSLRWQRLVCTLYSQEGPVLYLNQREHRVLWRGWARSWTLKRIKATVRGSLSSFGESRYSVCEFLSSVTGSGMISAPRTATDRTKLPYCHESVRVLFLFPFLKVI